MNCIQKMLAAALGCVLSALLLTGCGEKEEPVNITLANHSGHGITSISITPSTSDEWDTELVDGIFQSGEMMEVNLGSYKPSELPDFNILVYNEESYVLYDNDVDEVDFTIHDGDYVVFLSPDGDDSIVVCTSEEYDNLYAGDGENAPTGYTAEELGQTGGMSGFSGCWKLENAPFYFVINTTMSGLPSTSTASRSAPAMSCRKMTASCSAWRTTQSLFPSGRPLTAT